MKRSEFLNSLTKMRWRNAKLRLDGNTRVNKPDYGREGIIIPLDRHFVDYPRGAGVKEGASVVEKGAGVEDRGCRGRRPLLHRHL